MSVIYNKYAWKNKNLAADKSNSHGRLESTHRIYDVGIIDYLFGKEKTSGNFACNTLLSVLKYLQYRK